MPTITQLKYFQALADVRHFGKAAEKCHVSQPSLSAQIQKLEEELGAILLDRSKTPILLTETGFDVLEQTKIVLREHKKLRDVANHALDHPKGELNLGVIPTLAPYTLPLFLPTFSKAHADVRLHIHEHKTDDIIQMLLADELDAGLLVTPLEDPRLVERHLFFEPFYAYVSKSHPLSKSKRIQEPDLSGESLWLLEEGHCFRDQVLKVCDLERKSQVLSNVDFQSGSLETLMRMVRKLGGYTLLPELALEGMGGREREVYVRPFGKPVPTREVSLVTSRSFWKETILKALEDKIIEALPKEIKSLKRRDLTVMDVIS